MAGSPAFIRNGRLDVLATNQLGRALYSPLLPMELSAQPGPTLSAYSAAPGTPEHDSLRLLAARSATEASRPAETSTPSHENR